MKNGIKKYVTSLCKLYACTEAVEWVGTQPSIAAVWRECKRADWMLWVLGKVSGDVGSKSRKKLASCACECAELALPYAGKHKAVCKRVYAAIRGYHAGTNTLADVRVAADAAYALASAATSAAYAADAAYAAAYAADAADAAAYAASAANAAAYAARGQTLRNAADIVRKHYPRAPRLK